MGGWDPGGVGAPALQETTTQAAAAQMADALDLRHRLPMLWGKVGAGAVRAWKARAVAKATRHLSVTAAEPNPADPGTPPDQGAGHTSVRVEPVDPRVRGLDPAKLRPPVTLYLQLSAGALLAGHGVVRIEEVGPVLDPVDDTPVNAYEIPTLMRERVRLRNPVDIFPWATTPARGCDLDHTRAFLDPARGGPPGQTGPANLGPLSRSHHRTKTFTRWRVRQAEPGVYVWRSPNGWIYLVNPRGTHPLGNTPFAHAVWHAAQRQDAYVAAS